MLDYLGKSLSERRAHLAALEARVRSHDRRRQSPRRIARYLDAAKSVLSKPLTVAIVGEINTGKTELANLILGIQVLPTSVINNTFSPTMIRYGEVPGLVRHASPRQREQRDASELHRLVQSRSRLVECFLPLPMLKHVEVIDFPAFENANPLTDPRFALLRRSDVLVWCISSARAWTAAEKSTWLSLPAACKRNCLFALTHTDKLSGDALEAVLARVRPEIAGGGSQPIAIAITSAIESRSPRGQIVNGNLWTASGGERFVKTLASLLQAKAQTRQRRVDESTSRFLSNLGSGDPAAPHPLLTEWARLARFFDGEPSRPAVEAAAGAIAEFKRSVCEPWLRARDYAGAEIDAFLNLLPDNAEPMLERLPVRDERRLALIFQQLSCEIQEHTASLQIR